MDRSAIFSFTHPGFREHWDRGGRKIIKAREMAQDHKEIEFYKHWGPCSYEPTALVSACIRPMHQTHTSLTKQKPSMELQKWTAESNLS